MALNDLPTVITAPGDYVTRDGSRATIHRVSDGPETFSAKGGIWPNDRGPKGYEIWHKSGRAFPLNESGRDIVDTWPPALS